VDYQTHAFGYTNCCWHTHYPQPYGPHCDCGDGVDGYAITYCVKGPDNGRSINFINSYLLILVSI